MVHSPVLFQFTDQGTGDGVFLDFLGALIEFADFGVAIKALHLVLGNVAVAPVQLNGSSHTSTAVLAAYILAIEVSLGSMRPWSKFQAAL